MPDGERENVAKSEEPSSDTTTLSAFLGRGVREVFRDEALWVLDKPPKALSHPNPPAKSSPSALLKGDYDFERECYRLRGGSDKLRRVWLVHRLDRDTSGLILCALTPEAAATLKEALARREIEKQYHALVLGVPGEASGTWRDHLERSRREGRVEVAVVRGSNPNATTSYKVLERYTPAGLSLLALEPREGRTHQIRVQCARHGHPIAGDDRYGDFGANRELGKAAGIARTMLVAQRLCFEHPTTRRTVRFECEPPPDLAGVLAKLKTVRRAIVRTKR